MTERLLSVWHGMVDATVDHAPFILIAIAVFAAFLLIASSVSALLIRLGRQTRLDRTLAVLLARLSQSAIITLGFLIAAVIVLPNFRPVDLLAGLGFASVAIGFALKEILQNLFAGTLMLWRKPFLIGDEIRAQNFSGVVEDINVRATKIRTYEGTEAVIPNSQIYTNPVEVFTANQLRRVELIVGIGYPDSITRAKELILAVLDNLDGVSAPAVYVTTLAPSSVDLRIHFWTGAQQSNILAKRDSALLQIKSALDKEGIDIPYPHRVVLFHNVTGTADGDVPLPGYREPSAAFDGSQGKG